MKLIKSRYETVYSVFRVPYSPHEAQVLNARDVPDELGLRYIEARDKFAAIKLELEEYFK